MGTRPAQPHLPLPSWKWLQIWPFTARIILLLGLWPLAPQEATLVGVLGPSLFKDTHAHSLPGLYLRAQG